MKPAADHPVQTLLFFVDDLFSAAQVDQMRSLIENLSRQRPWVIAAPEFIYSAEVTASASPVDQPIKTLGGELRIYSALPPWDAKLPREIDRQHYLEVEKVVEDLSRFSLDSGLSIGFELDGVSVGWVKNGQPDAMLAKGLLEEWKKGVGL